MSKTESNRMEYTPTADSPDIPNQVVQKKKYAYPRNLLSHIRLGLVVVARTEKYANPMNLEPVLRISKDFL